MAGGGAGAQGGVRVVSVPVLFDVAGPRGRRRIAVSGTIGVLVIGALLGLAATRLASKDAFDADLWRVLTRGDVLRLLGRGLVATLEVAGIAMALSMGLGALLAVGRLSPRTWISRPVGAWVNPLAASRPDRGGLRHRPWPRSGASPDPPAAGRAPDAARTGEPARHPAEGHLARLCDRLHRAAAKRPHTAVEFLGGRYSIPIYTGIAVAYIAVNASLSYAARRLDLSTRQRYGQAVVTVQRSAVDEAA